VHIFGNEVPVHAGIHTISGFSAHADQAELLAWHRQTGHPKTTFLVHGEDRGMQAFASKLENTKV
jgi:metallo-beta-lactamase family protein